MPGTDLVGYGGPRMQEAGCRLLVDMTQWAIMWFGEAIKNYFRLRGLVNEAKRLFDANHFDAVVLVDYPGFNWHIARAAKKHGIPVYYFMPPQVWAWAQWRTAKMRDLITHTLSPLRFETEWFIQQGIKTTYIGHPFFEENRNSQIDEGFLEPFYTQNAGGPILLLLPGSRNQEVKQNLDDMLMILARVQKKIPYLRPVFAAFNRLQADLIVERLEMLEYNVPIYIAKTPELIRAADCCLAVSGSVSMELLACNKPTVIYYKVGLFPHIIQRFFRRSRFITLVNLLNVYRKYGRLDAVLYDDSVRIAPAEPSEDERAEMIFPEYLTSTDSSKAAAAHLISWLESTSELAAVKRELAALLEDADNVPSPLEEAAKRILYD